MAKSSITATNKSPLVQVLVWFFFFVALFVFAVRQVTRRVLVLPFKIEDGIISVAVALSLAQTIAVSIATKSGLGKASRLLSDGQMESTLKSHYTAIILLILCLGMIKLSVVYFTRGLSPDKRHRQQSTMIGAIVTVWMVIGVISSIFQCSPPRTWDYISGSKCVNMKALWTTIAIGNMATDVIIVAAQLHMLWKLQIPLAKRLLLLLIFSLRMSVVGASIAQLSVYYASLRGGDLTLRLWIPMVLNNATQALSLATACVPHVKRFLDSLESGMIRVAEPRESGDQSIELEAYGASRSTATTGSGVRK